MQHEREGQRADGQPAGSTASAPSGVTLVREGLATTNPAADVFQLPSPKRLPKFLTISEQERALTLPSRDTTLPGPARSCAIATGLFCGLRVAELAGLKVSDIDLEAGPSASSGAAAPEIVRLFKQVTRTPPGTPQFSLT